MTHNVGNASDSYKIVFTLQSHKNAMMVANVMEKCPS
jgi:hypothetical protein